MLIVESPTKVKTIKKYLGKDYDVMTSYGHVRDLESKSGSVDPDHNFKMMWTLTSRGAKQVKAIVDACKKADTLYLATDPDREGEAISWHIKEILKSKKIKCDIKRITFFEITEKAVKEALEHPRDINQDLVNAYLARRSLDYLFGFTLSPVLWRKLPGAKSAGRVQSVALRLITEREDEIKVFIPQEYWSAYVLFQKFDAKLTVYDKKKVEKLFIKDKAQAEGIKKTLEACDFLVNTLEKKSVKRQPPPPFMTATLQQAASRQIGFSSKKTMTVAQTLYEGLKIGTETQGLITYMRTDSLSLSNEALNAIRGYIAQKYDAQYLPKSPRVYKKKVRNAQEAHEAIRPIDVNLTPEKVQKDLTPDQYKLYKLIWERAVASQLSEALFDRVTAKIESTDQKHELGATGTTCTFKGFLILHRDDEEDEREEEKKLPLLKEGQALDKKGVEINQHFTQPPPRYNEASLVKKLVELGIGRPSTYVSLIETLKTRQYVRLDNKQFIPENRGKIVTYFLEKFFHKYVEYDFTALLEEKLDEISSGKNAYIDVLEDFWKPFSEQVKGTMSLTVTEVIDYLEEKIQDEKKPCPLCKKGTLNLKLSKYGAFLGCSLYPDCKYAAPLEGEDAGDLQEKPEDNSLGVDPETQSEVYLKKGPYGYYVQVGAKRTAMPKNIEPQDLTLKQALMLNKLPLKIGEYEDKDVQVGIGRFGPYVKHGSVFASIPKGLSLFGINLDEAIGLLQQKQAKVSAKKK
ncbi:MAG: type I DNA topoisomerase [Alphaproteobacteria bacterium]|nr:MAG: type I DNA topoisomerase [Alphaproteobacteria bacterium]